MRYPADIRTSLEKAWYLRAHLGLPLKRVARELGMRKPEHHWSTDYLRKYTADDAEYNEMKVLCLSSQTCLACGKVLVMPRYAGYCTGGCIRRFNPKKALVQHRLGKPLRDGIVEILNRTDRPKDTADRLGVAYPTLVRWMGEMGIERRWA